MENFNMDGIIYLYFMLYHYVIFIFYEPLLTPQESIWNNNSEIMSLDCQSDGLRGKKTLIMFAVKLLKSYGIWVWISKVIQNQCSQAKIRGSQLQPREIKF